MQTSGISKIGKMQDLWGSVNAGRLVFAVVLILDRVQVKAFELECSSEKTI